MKHFSQQLHKKATTTVKLQAVEKRELRERLQAYMEYHPLPATMKAQPAKQPVVEQFATEAFTVVKVPFQALFKYGAAFAAIVLVAVPFLAQQAMPGDALYAIKVQFNEELRGTLTFDSYQKVEWETERLNRRIAEARLLASEGRLTEEVEAEMANAVREHTESAKREIEVLRGEDADEAEIASIALDTTLEVQSTSLKGKDAEEGVAAAARPISLIATAIDESRDTANEHATSTVPAYDKLMARVELNTTRIYELRSALEEIAPVEELGEVDRRIADLERLVQTAIETVVADETAARKALVDVLQRTQRLIVFMTEIEVSETVDIETIVPVVLTDEEKQAEIASSTAEVAMKRERIEFLLTDVTDDAVAEKVLVSQEELAALAEEMATTTNDFAAFRLLATEAVTLADDTIRALEQYYTPEDLPVPDEEQATSTEEVASSTEEIIPEFGEEQATSTEEVASSTEEDLSDSAIDSVASGTVDSAS